MLSFLLCFVFLLSLIIALLAYFLSWKNVLDLEQLSPFECGFNSKDSSRIFFSVHFFLIALIFVIFDVELILLFPILSESNILISCSSLMMFIFTVVLLTLGLIWEWLSKMLEWVS